MAALMPLGKQQYFAASGAPLVGGKVYTYAAGTTSPLSTYSDKAGVTPNTNPVVLDSRGEATIFWGQAGYKVVLKDSTDATIWTQDNLYAVQDSSSMTFAQQLITATAGQTVFNLSISYTNGTNSLAVYMNGLRLASTDYTETSTTSVTLNTGATVGDELLFVAGDYAASTTGADLVTYTPAGTGAVATTVQAKLRESVSVKDFGADETGVADSTTAFTNALATGKSVFIPPGTYLITSSLTVSTPGQMIYGAGYGQSVVQRGSDTSFIMFNVTAAWGVEFHNFKIQEPNVSYTNTGSYIQCAQSGGTDVLIQGMWFWYGWQHVRCMQGTSNITFSNCVFEAARKGAIYSYSSARNKVVGCTFWKNSADYSNPADRGYAVNLTKDGVYSFGSDNWNIVGNYFAENVYGPFILANTSTGLQITGNFFEIASQVDNGQKSDIEFTSCTRVSIVGNASDSINNSYAAGARGSKYCVDLSGGGNTLISIVGNNFQAGVTGTINDSSNVSTRIGNTYTDSTTENLITSTNYPAFSGNSGVKTSNAFVGYEEGTWTPSLTFGGAAVGQTGTFNGRYTRVGRLVNLSGTLIITAKGSSTGTARIAGLPFPSNASVTSGYILECDGGVTVTGQLMMFNGGNSSAFGLYQQNNGSASALTDTAFTTPTIRFSITYEV